MFLAHWAYGAGVNKAWREIRKTGGGTGLANRSTMGFELLD